LAPLSPAGVMLPSPLMEKSKDCRCNHGRYGCVGSSMLGVDTECDDLLAPPYGELDGYGPGHSVGAATFALELIP